MASVEIAKRQPRSREAIEHEVSGGVWLAVAAILVIIAYEWATNLGVLGYVFSPTGGVGLSIVLLAVLVICVLLWESTKTVVSKGKKAAKAILPFSPVSLVHVSGTTASQSCGLNVACWLSAFLDGIAGAIYGGILAIWDSFIDNFLGFWELVWQVIESPLKLILSGFTTADADFVSLGIFGPIVAVIIAAVVIWILFQVDLPIAIGGAKEDLNDAAE